MDAMYALERESTGAFEISVFQGLSGRKTGQFPIPAPGELELLLDVAPLELLVDLPLLELPRELPLLEVLELLPDEVELPLDEVELVP